MNRKKYFNFYLDKRNYCKIEPSVNLILMKKHATNSLSQQSHRSDQVTTVTLKTITSKFKTVAESQTKTLFCNFTPGLK